MPHQRDWIDYLLAFAPFMAMIVAVSVGLMQAFVQRQAQKQNLFDKRFKVYDACAVYLAKLLGDSTEVDYHTFRTDTVPGEMLFGSEVVAFLVKVGDTGLKLNQVKLERRTCYRADRRRPTKPEWDDLMIKEKELTASEKETLNTSFDELNSQTIALQHNMKDVFLPYLALHTDQHWFSRFAMRLTRWVNQDLPATLKNRYEE